MWRWHALVGHDIMAMLSKESITYTCECGKKWPVKWRKRRKKEWF